jgi:hypothetical protein
MDTSNNLNFSLLEAMGSEYEEERALAEKAYAIVDRLVEQLKPIMKYISKPLCKNPRFQDRGILIYDDYTEESDSLLRNRIFLLSNGKFIVFTGSREKDPEKFAAGEREWDSFNVSWIITGLQVILAGAVRMREKHLKSIEERSKKLDKIMEILES